MISAAQEQVRHADPEAPPVTRANVLRCQMHEWYPTFRQHSIKTKFITLESDFVDYLLADGLILPEGCDAPKVRNSTDPQQDIYDSDGWSDDYDGASDDDGLLNSPKVKFDALLDQMRAAIQELGGVVFPKLNWSAPRDATWINAGENTKCVSPSEIIMLLKSSDLIVHDLCHAFDCCQDSATLGEHSTHDAREARADLGLHLEVGQQQNEEQSHNEVNDRDSNDMTRGRPSRVTLALRKWFDIKQCFEFRCFVRRGTLVGVSQRDVSTFYPFLLEGDMKTKILETLKHFYETELSGKFADDSFVFDAYIRQRDFRVFVIDVNPYGGLTQTLLFSWKDLQESDGNEPELRLISDQPSIRPPMSMYGRMPKEMHDVARSQEGIDNLVDQLRALKEASNTVNNVDNNQ